MANDISTKVWDLDTAGVITTSPVIIEGIAITWKVASVGSVVIDQISEGVSGQVAAAEIFSAQSLGATSAGVNNMTYFWPIKTTVESMRLTTIVEVGKLFVYTK